MFHRINSQLSLGARLGLLGVVFSAPALILLWLFVGSQVDQLNSAVKELRGSAYVAQVWAGMRGAKAAAPPALAEMFGARPQFTAYAAAAASAKAAAGAELIGAVADGSNLTLDPELDSFYAMDAVTARLPALYSAEVAMSDAASRGDRDGVLAARGSMRRRWGCSTRCARPWPRAATGSAGGSWRGRPRRWSARSPASTTTPKWC